MHKIIYILIILLVILIGFLAFLFEWGFEKSDKIQDKSDCIITGCSKQICSNQEVMTTCEYKPEFACYQNAVCEKQENSKCEWTETEELKQCLNKN